MKLKTKPDFDNVKERWNAFWTGEFVERPMICASVPKNESSGQINLLETCYWNPCNGKYEEQLDLIDKWIDSTSFMYDLIPFVSADHGPDQFAAWMGSHLKFSRNNIVTNWAQPILEDWETFLPVSLKKDNETWQSFLKYSALLKERGQNKYIVGMADLHSHMDAFSALRHPDKLCMDLYDTPEIVKKGCGQARAMYPEIYEKIYSAGGMSSETGTIGWLPLWCEGKTAVVQCDFSVFLSNEMWKEFVLPGIREEIEFLDHCFYHLDGKQQLIHLDDLLAIKKLDGIQWVPGAGQPEMFSRHWRYLLKKILDAGKKIIVYGNMDLDVIKDVHQDLGYKNIVYDIHGRTREEIEEIAAWFLKNC